MSLNKKINNILLLSFLALFLFSCSSKSGGADKKSDKNDTTVVVSGDTAVVINMENPVAEEKILLKFQPPIGTTYYITNNTTYTAFQSQDTFKMNAVSTKYAKLKLRILSKDADLFKIEFTLLDSKKSIKDDSTVVDYVYGKPLDDPKADLDRKIEDCMVNAPLVITINEDGEGTDVEGYDAIIAKIKAIVKKELNTDIPDDYIASEIGTPTDNLENFFISYPDTAVKIGDKWDFTTPSVLQGVPIILTNHYTLADRKNGIAYVNFSTNVVIDKSQIPAEALSKMTNLKFNAYIKGTGEIDEKTGWPLMMKTAQGMELSDIIEGVPSKTKQTSNGVLRSSLQQ